MLLDQPDGFVREQVGGVAFLAERLVVAVPVEASVTHVGEVVQGAVVMPILVVEAAGCGQISRVEVAYVPFAADGGFVAGILERLR